LLDHGQKGRHRFQAIHRIPFHDSEEYSSNLPYQPRFRKTATIVSGPGSLSNDLPLLSGAVGVNAPASSVSEPDNAELSSSPPVDLPDRYRGGTPGDQKKVRRHIVELDAHRDALREAHPTEGRIDESQQLAAGAAVLVLDAVSDALDVSRQNARIADQFYSRILADTNAPQLGFLEIPLDAVRVGIDQRKDSCAGIDVAAGQKSEIGDYAVDWRHDGRALEIELRDFKRRVRRVEFSLIDVDRLLPLLDLLDGDREVAQTLGTLEITLGLV